MPDARGNKYVVDASYVLSFLLADERVDDIDALFLEYVQGAVKFVSSDLLPYEVCNGLVSAYRQKRISLSLCRELTEQFFLLGIPLQTPDHEVCREIALKDKLTIYDASYLALSRAERAKLMTHDRQLLRLL